MIGLGGILIALGFAILGAIFLAMAVGVRVTRNPALPCGGCWLCTRLNEKPRTVETTAELDVHFHEWATGPTVDREQS